MRKASEPPSRACDPMTIPMKSEERYSSPRGPQSARVYTGVRREGGSRPTTYLANLFLCPSRRLLLSSPAGRCRSSRATSTLLHVLIRRRDEAIPRREILDTVWRDVVVSDGA